MADDADALIAEHYRWWTVMAGRYFVKLGPVSIAWYRWFDGRWRVSVFWFSSKERIIVGGPLT